MGLFSWQCQNPCRLSLAFIIDWRVVYLGLVHGPGVRLPGRSLRKTLSDVLVVVFYVESRDRLGQPVPTERAVPTQEGPTGTPNGVAHLLRQEALRFLCKKEIAATMSKTIRG